MKIDKHIKAFLLKGKSIVIEGFGSLSIKYVTAKIDQKTNQLSPPHNKIFFNPANTFKDDAFADFIADQENISKEEGISIIKDFISELKTTIESNKEFKIDDVGLFYQNEFGKPEFKFTSKDNFLTDAFGLETYNFTPQVKEPVIDPKQEIPTAPPPEKTPSELTKPKPVVTEKAAPTPKPKPIVTPPVVKEKKPFPVKWLVAAFVIILISTTVGLFMFTDVFNPIKEKIADLKKDPHAYVMDTTEFTEALEEFNNNPFDIDTTLKEIEEPEDFDPEKVEEKIDDISEKQSALDPGIDNNEIPKPKTPTSTSRYYIIAGSFGSIENAEKLANELTLQGYPAEVITKDQKKFRVSLQSFDNKFAAVQELNKIKEANSEANYWLLKM